MYCCDLSLTSCTFVKLELREHGTNSNGDAGEFDKRLIINLKIHNLELVVISRNRRHSSPQYRSDSGVHRYGDYGIAATKSVNKIKSNVANFMYCDYLDCHILVNAERPLM